MASIFKRKADRKRPGAPWYIAYADENGKRRTVKGATDREVTQRLANRLEDEARQKRDGLIDPRAETLRDHGAKPLVDHLADFQQYLTAKGGTKSHAVKTRRRAEKVLTRTGAARSATCRSPRFWMPWRRFGTGG